MTQVSSSPEPSTPALTRPQWPSSWTVRRTCDPYLTRSGLGVKVRVSVRVRVRIRVSVKVWVKVRVRVRVKVRVRAGDKVRVQISMGVTHLVSVRVKVDVRLELLFHQLYVVFIIRLLIVKQHQK